MVAGIKKTIMQVIKIKEKLKIKAEKKIFIYLYPYLYISSQSAHKTQLVLNYLSLTFQNEMTRSRASLQFYPILKKEPDVLILGFKPKTKAK